jgi:hypothetical protein
MVGWLVCCMASYFRQRDNVMYVFNTTFGLRNGNNTRVSLIHVTVSARHVQATRQAKTLTPLQIIKVALRLSHASKHLPHIWSRRASMRLPGVGTSFITLSFIYRSFKQTSDDKHSIPFPQTRISHLYPHHPIIDSISVFPSIRLRSGNTPAALPTSCGSFAELKF